MLFQVTGGDQISDKYQHCGHADFPMARSTAQENRWLA